jgi:hypothetical protein
MSWLVSTPITRPIPDPLSNRKTGLPRVERITWKCCANTLFLQTWFLLDSLGGLDDNLS